MVFVENCCWCFDLRVGSILTGVYVLAIYLVELGLYVRETKLCYGAVVLSEINSLEEPLLYVLISIHSLVALLACVVSIALIFAIFIYIPSVVMVYVVTMVIVMVTQLGTTFIMWLKYYAIVSTEYPQLHYPFSMGAVIFYIFYTGLHMYSLLVVISQFQEMREGRGRQPDSVAKIHNAVPGTVHVMTVPDEIYRNRPKPSYLAQNRT